MSKKILVQYNVELASLHTFAMPARAARLVTIASHEDILAVATLQDWCWDSTRLLGGGSNSIFIDDFRGTIIKCALKQRSITFHTKKPTVEVIAGAGELWDEFVAWTVAQGGYGLENLSWIPGTVGAAPLQNIGAYGVEIADYLTGVEVYDHRQPARGFFWLDRDECGFGYRDSYFKTKWSHCIISRVRFRLSTTFKPILKYPGLIDYAEQQHTLTALQVRLTVIQLRQSKLPDPDDIPNAGSFFKNPIVPLAHFNQLSQHYKQIPGFKVKQAHQISYKLPAAWLLEQAGFKGQWQHEFGCYQLQPLVLVHDASQRNALPIKKSRLLQWIEHIQHTVQLKFAIALEIEPELVGQY